MKKLFMILVMVGCTEPNASSVPTTNFCADGDTECSCRQHPDQAGCGDLPNSYDVGLQPTLDYAAEQGVQGANTVGRYHCSNVVGGVHCDTWGTFLGVTYYVACDFTRGMGGTYVKTCHAGITPAGS